MNSANKQVKTIKYNKKYFESLFKSHDYSKKVKFASFGHIYRDLANLCKLSPGDKVVDFGCGNGELSFCLYQKYGAEVTGIDYSGDAIQIAKDNLVKLCKIDKNPNIRFINVNNDGLPKLKNISYVYFCDVLEHMYDHEISQVLKRVKLWNNKKIRIVVHTDNNTFLRFVRPFIDGLSIITGTSSVHQVQSRNLWESERHVNLTNPSKFRKNISKYGFNEVKLFYPEVNMDKIERQLGGLSRLPLLKKIVFFALKMLKPLSPSFYGVYEYESR